MRSRFRPRPAAGLLAGALALTACETTLDPAPSGPTDTCASAKAGQICTVVGESAAGFDGDGNHRLESQLYWPFDLNFDEQDGMYLLDWNNHRVRRVLADDTLETIMGTEVPGDGAPGNADVKPEGADGTTISLNHPSDLFIAKVDSALAPKGQLVLAAWHNHVFRKWNPATRKVNVQCGKPGVGGFLGDGQKAGAATRFNQPSKITQDGQGNVYLVDMRNWRIRKISADGVVSTVAGTGKGGYDDTADQGPLDAKQAKFLFFDPVEWSNPTSSSGGLATSADGKTLYVTDTENHRIRAIDLASGQVTTLAGSGPSGCLGADGKPAECVNDGTAHPTPGAFSGDGGPATQARLNRPHDLVLGPDGKLYFADTGNHRVRAIDLKAGTIATVAGNGKAPVGIKPMKVDEIGDGKAATQASLNQPRGVAFDSKGHLYVADTYNQRIRKIIGVGK